MSTRPASDEYAPFAEQYIRQVPDGDIRDILKSQLESTSAFLRTLSQEQAGSRYAPGKWSPKEIFGHLIDGERMWSYRILRIVRNDVRELPGYDRDVFTAQAAYDDRLLPDIVEEYTFVRQSTLAQLKNIPADAWSRQGVFADHPLSARAAAYIIAGHEIHHLGVIQEKYLSV